MTLSPEEKSTLVAYRLKRADDVVPYIEPTKNLIDAVKELIG